MNASTQAMQWRVRAGVRTGARARLGFFGSLGLTIAAFAIIYNVSFKFNESLTSGRLAVAALLVCMALTGRRWPVLRDWRVLLLFLPLPYVLVQWVFTHDYGQFSRFFHLALYSYVGAMLVACLAGELEDLLRVMLAAISIQAVLLLVSFVSIDYRVWVDSVLVWGNNFDIDDLYRAPGFASTGGSALSVVQSLGVVTGGALLHVRRLARGERPGFLVLFQMLLCVASCVVVGRTGLLLSLLFFVAFVLALGAGKRAFVLGVVLFVPLLLVAWPIVEAMLPANFSADFFVQWAFGFLLSGSDASVAEVNAMPIPPLSTETLFGTGLVSVLLNGMNPSGHDSGLVQAYYSMGLVMAVAFYALYAFVLYRLLDWLPRGLAVVLGVSFLLIEVKEPFLFKYAIMFVLMAMAMCAPPRRPAQAGQPAPAVRAPD